MICNHPLLILHAYGCISTAVLAYPGSAGARLLCPAGSPRCSAAELQGRCSSPGWGQLPGPCWRHLALLRPTPHTLLAPLGPLQWDTSSKWTLEGTRGVSGLRREGKEPSPARACSQAPNMSVVSREGVNLLNQVSQQLSFFGKSFVGGF